MPRLSEARRTLLESLEQHYGMLPWPGQGRMSVAQVPPFEAIVGVALGRVAEPRVASAAHQALLDAGLMEPGQFAVADPVELDDLFRQARVRLSSKALQPLRRIARWVSQQDFGAEAASTWSTESLREAWQGLNGVGSATVEALLLFAMGRATYPVDRASYRILVRHGWLDPSSDHDEARSVLESIAPDDPDRLGQLSLAFEKLGRDACKPFRPNCERCPLRSLLPESGPVTLDETG